MRKSFFKKHRLLHLKTKLKVGDLVKVIAGSNRKKNVSSAEIIKIYHQEGFVTLKHDDFALKRKSKKPTNTSGEEQKVMETVPYKIHISNVIIIDPKNKKPTKIGYKFVNGKKVRFSKTTGEILR